MRHGRGYRKLGRTSSHRRALLRNLVSSLFLAPGARIATTVEKAKEARRLAEKMITLGKRETLHARRLAAAFLLDPKALKRLFDEIAPTFTERKGGYTRILRLGPRAGDNADMALLELVGLAESAQKAAAAKAEKSEKKDKGEAAKDADATREAKAPARREKPAREKTPRPDAKTKAATPPKGRIKGGGKRGE